MPIEQTVSPRRSISARTARKPGRAASGPPSVGPTVINPITSRPALAALSTSAGTSSRRHPPLPRFTGGVDLDHHSCTGNPLGELGDKRQPVDRLVDRDDGGEHAHLVGLQLADEVDPEWPVDSTELGHDLLGVVFADSRTTSAVCGPAGFDPESLGDRQNGYTGAAGAGDALVDLGQARLDQFVEVGHCRVTRHRPCRPTVADITSRRTVHRSRRRRCRVGRRPRRRIDPSGMRQALTLAPP